MDAKRNTMYYITTNAYNGLVITAEDDERTACMFDAQTKEEAAAMDISNVEGMTAEQMESEYPAQVFRFAPDDFETCEEIRPANNELDKAAWLDAVEGGGVGTMKAATGILYINGDPFQVFTTEADINIDGRTLRGCLVEKAHYCADEPGAIDYMEQLSIDVWEI